MTRIEKVLIARDGLSKIEAEQRINQARAEFDELIASGADYGDIEDFMDSEFGLEMDYIYDLL